MTKAAPFPLDAIRDEAAWERASARYLALEIWPPDEFFDLLHRGFDASFVGPVVAPMQLWLMRGGKLHRGAYPGSIGWANSVGKQFAFDFEGAL